MFHVGEALLRETGIDHPHPTGNNRIDSSVLAVVNINRKNGETMTSDEEEEEEKGKLRRESSLMVTTTTPRGEREFNVGRVYKAGASAKRGSFRTLRV